MSIAAAASTVASSTANTAASSSASSGKSALTSLSSNFQDFLGMLMTQLQNQDPTSPMDTNTFTTELVQFSGVEQQISTNSTLTQLISLTQSGQMLQASSIVGSTVQMNSNEMPLQSGSGSLTFTAASAGQVGITVTNSAGSQVLSTTVSATAGSNTWNWDGKSMAGTTQPDGDYKVTVTDSKSTAVPFTVSGKVTGVVNNSGTLDLQLGAATAAFSTVQSVSQ